MIKKRIFTFLFVAVVCFLGVFTYSQMNQYDYETRLNHTGLSDEALRFPTKSNQKISTFLKKLDDEKINNYQIQFKLKNNPNTTLFFGKGNYGDLPTVSGRLFSQSDFTSRIPVVVIGQDVKKNVYTPTDQSYLYKNKRYLSIIGVMGTNFATNLDKQTLISVTPTNSFGSTRLKNVNIIVDSANINATKSTFKGLLNASTPTRYVPKTQPIVGTQWLSHNLVFVSEIIFGILVLIIFTELWIYYIRRGALIDQFKGWNWSRIRWGLFRQYTFRVGLGMLVGMLVGIWRFYLMNYRQLLILYILVFSGLLIYFYIRIEYLHQHNPKIKE